MLGESMVICQLNDKSHQILTKISLRNSVVGHRSTIRSSDRFCLTCCFVNSKDKTANGNDKGIPYVSILCMKTIALNN